MTATTLATADRSDLVLVLTRVFDAPRERVFAAWTQAEQVLRWAGPQGFTMTAGEMDFREGGAYRFTMRSPEGDDWCWEGVYRKIAAPERLVFSFNCWNVAEDRPNEETIVTVTFEAQGDKTKLTLRQELFESAEICQAHRDGWGTALDRMAEVVG